MTEHETTRELGEIQTKNYVRNATAMGLEKNKLSRENSFFWQLDCEELNTQKLCNQCVHSRAIVRGLQFRLINNKKTLPMAIESNKLLRTY